MTDEELEKLFERSENKLEGEIDDLHRHFERTENKLEGKIDDLHHHFDVVAERFDTKFDLLAEGVLNVDEKMDRNHAAIREEMRQGFSDTHDLIKYAYNLARPKR